MIVLLFKISGSAKCSADINEYWYLASETCVARCVQSYSYSNAWLCWDFHSFTLCLAFVFFWKEEASSFCWPCGTDHAVQTDLWLSNKEIESACWRYSSTRPQLLTSKACFLCVLPLSSFHLKYSHPSQSSELWNHSSCHYPFFFLFLRNNAALDRSTCCKSSQKIQSMFPLWLNVVKPFFAKLLVQSAIGGGWNISVNLCEIFVSPFPSSMTVAHSFLGCLLGCVCSEQYFTSRDCGPFCQVCLHFIELFSWGQHE